MAGDTIKWLVLPLLLLAATSILQHHVVDGKKAEAKAQVPCLFIFGDSLSDTGNNNHLPSTAKANYKPYGIDFPYGTTGRFTNGLTSIDFITLFLGFDKLIPPYANTTGSDILKGVNYATGASGLRDETGMQLGGDINIGLQLIKHRMIVSQTASKLRRNFEDSQDHLSKCLYYMNIGGQDYINNYFITDYYQSKKLFTPEKYAEDLIKKYSEAIKDLHYLGARKFVLVGVGLIGCTPKAKMLTPGNNAPCVDEINNAAQIFNKQLKSLADELTKELSDTKFIYIDSMELKFDPTDGTKVDTPCCEKLEKTGLCAPDSKTCENRNQYVYFDAFHPSQAANIMIAMASYNGSDPKFTYPMDISHLVQS